LLLLQFSSYSEDVYNSHMQLIEAESSMLSGDHNVDTIQAKLDKLQAERQRFEREKERMEEREKAEALVKLLQKKRMWEDYNLQQAEVIELHAEKKASKVKLRQAQAELEPLEEEKKEISARKKEIDAEHKQLERHLIRFKDEMNKSEQKHEKFDDAIESTMADLQQIDAARSRKLDIYAKAKERVQQIEANLRDTHCSPEQLDQNFNEASQEKKIAHRALSAARIECQNLHQQTTRLEEDIDRLSSKLSKLQDEKAQRRQEVARKWPQVEQILRWLDENRKLFRRPVYGPVVSRTISGTHEYDGVEIWLLLTHHRLSNCMYRQFLHCFRPAKSR
jgi:chromosome segregation ATPase